MKNISTLKIGQKFTNGSTETIFELTGELTARNLDTNEIITLTECTHVYSVNETIIKTVIEHNENQTSRCMMFDNKNGSLKKRGFVVSLNLEISENVKIDKENGIYSIYCKTLMEAKSKTANDFIASNNCPIWWDKDLGMSKLEAMHK